MKNLIFILSLLTSGSSIANTNLFYNCGKSFGYDVTIQIRDNVKGSFYPLAALYTAPGTDPVTHTLIRSKAYKMEGDSDLIATRQRKDEPVYQFHELENEGHQVIIKKSLTAGRYFDAVEIDVKTSSQTSLKCVLMPIR